MEIKKTGKRYGIAIVSIALALFVGGYTVKAVSNVMSKENLSAKDAAVKLLEANLEVAQSELKVAQVKYELVKASLSDTVDGILGTQITMNTSNSTYTDGADFRQNVQAMAERMAGLTQYQVLQADSNGRMQAVSYPENQATGGTDLTTTTMSTATTLTQSELTSYNYFSVTPNVVADMTYTFPASSTLTSFIPNTGDRKTIIFDNTTTTIGTDLRFAVGVGTYLLHTSSTPFIMASSTGELTFIRRANTDVVVEFESYSNN